MPRPRMFAKGAGVGGRLYAAGGIVPPGRRQFPWLDVYDPQRDRWSVAADMPMRRDAYRVAVARGRVYVIGQLGLGADVLEFDPRVGAWSVRAPMPTQRYDFGVAAVGTRIYTFGGNGSDAVEVYDAGSDRWSVRGAMPHANWCQVAAFVEPYIYVTGGGFPARNVLKCVWKFGPVQ